MSISNQFCVFSLSLLFLSLSQAKISETVELYGTEVALKYSQLEVSEDADDTRWIYKNVELKMVSGERAGESFPIQSDSSNEALGTICEAITDGKYPRFMGMDYSGDLHIKNHGFLFGLVGGPSESIRFLSLSSNPTTLEIEEYDSDFIPPTYWRNVVCSDSTYEY